MTGKYNSRNYVAFETLDAEETTFAHILKAAGYKTCIAGKWQLSGRDRDCPGTSPVAAGFDEYCLWQMDEQTSGSRYWAPTIRRNGKLIEGVGDAYGPDVFCRFVCKFIEANRERPFFVYYPMVLTHGPHVPTPASQEGGKGTKRNTRYFADMVAYSDRIVSQILDKLHETGLATNTLVLFTGDNGTDKKVTSQWGNRRIQGGKGRTIDAGTHVPLITYWHGVTPEAGVCEDLIDFSDFLPTFVDLSKAPVPAGLTHDGVSFLPQVQGRAGTPKDYIFCHYEKGKYPYEGQKETGRDKEGSKPRRNRLPYTRFVRDKRWKLYHDGRLFDVLADPQEANPIPQGTEGQAEVIRARFQAVLDSMKQLPKRSGK
jgi:arylsulfatase A